MPTSAIIGTGYTPTSGESNDTDFSLEYAAGWELPNRWEVDAGLRWFSLAEEGDRFTEWAPSVVLKTPLLCERTIVHVDPKQRQVLSYRGGKMGVSAVPGSGKTATLSLLAAQILASDVLEDDQEILIVTLVNSAVDNFSSRIGSFARGFGLIPNLGYRVRTLHGLAHDSVRERPDLVNLDNNFQIVDERLADQIREEAAQAWLRSNPYARDGFIDPELDEDKMAWVRRDQLPELVNNVALSFIRYAKDQALTPEREMAVRLSREKAQTASSLIPHPSSFILLASDTVVSLDGEPLGKPGDAAEARSMLRRLRGRTHQVYTAITLIDRQANRSITDLAGSDVPMRNYTDEEIEAYIASGDPFDKAGAYAIQHDGFRPVENFAHCFANVMGLPLCHALRSLRRLGVEMPDDVPALCQAHLRYECPVFESILMSGE